MRKFWRITSTVLTQPVNIDIEITTETPTDSDGPILGFDLSIPYTDIQAANMLLTIEQGSNKPVREVPLAALKVKTGNLYVPFDEPLSSSGKITVTLQSLIAGSAAATPVIVSWYHKNPNASDNDRDNERCNCVH